MRTEEWKRQSRYMNSCLALKTHISGGLCGVVRYLAVCVVNLGVAFVKHLMCVYEVCVEGFCGGSTVVQGGATSGFLRASR